MRKIILFVLGVFFSLSLAAQTAPAAYWVQFTDKNHNSYSLNKPLEFLSQRSLDRRTKQELTLSENDLPVTKGYLDSLKRIGARILFTSRWQNAAAVFAPDSNFVLRADSISIVRSIIKILPKGIGILKTDGSMLAAIDQYAPRDYGLSYSQLHIHNGEVLHENGFQGQGILIGLLDAGFYHVDSLKAFQKLRDRKGIMDVHDFITGNDSVYVQDTHGMMVLSVMAGNLEGKLIGTAPEADYILYRTENSVTEYEAEEATWIAGMEKLDSAGVDVVNSSLGYTTFDDPTTSHSYIDLDGHTAICSKEASLCASKGIILVNSAGNSGSKPWHYISVPGDADNILTVGAVGKDRKLAGYSSRGQIVDGRMKPDVMGIGYQTIVATTEDGEVQGGNGTSFSSPAIAGLTACLWQEFPNKTCYQIMDAIRRSSDRFSNPDDSFGYGIPDFAEARQLLKINGLTQDFFGGLYPNPFTDNFNLTFYTTIAQSAEVELVNDMGQVMWKQKVQTQDKNFTQLSINGPSKLSRGVYFVWVKTQDANLVGKVVKE